MVSVNEAGWERALRLVVAAVLLYLGFGGVVAGVWGVVLIVIGFLMLITGLVGWCPLYTALGTGTKKMAMETAGAGGMGEEPSGRDTGPPEEHAAEPAEETWAPEPPAEEEDPEEERPSGPGGF